MVLVSKNRDGFSYVSSHDERNYYFYKETLSNYVGFGSWVLLTVLGFLLTVMYMPKLLIGTTDIELLLVYGILTVLVMLGSFILSIGIESLIMMVVGNERYKGYIKGIDLDKIDDYNFYTLFSFVIRTNDEEFINNNLDTLVNIYDEVITKQNKGDLPSKELYQTLYTLKK